LEEYTADLTSRVARDRTIDLRLRRDAIGLMAYVRQADPCGLATDPSQPGELRREALEVLARRGSAAWDCAERLALALRDPDCQVQLLAARGLAAIGPRAECALPALRAVDDHCIGVGQAARRAIEVISRIDPSLAAGELSVVLGSPGYPFHPEPRPDYVFD
jgi:hypothetical protein